MKETLSWLWPYFKKYSIRYAIGLVFVLVAAALTMVNPFVLGMIVDEVIVKGDVPLLWILLVVMLFITFLRMTVRYNSQMRFERYSQAAVRSIREDLYGRIQRLDFAFYDTNQTGDIMARLSGDIEAIRHFLAWVVYGSFENAVIFLTSIIAFFFINAVFTLVLLLALPVVVWLAFRLSKEVKPTFAAIRNQFSQLNTRVQENIAGNRVVKAFSREDHEVKKFMKENLEFKARNLESAAVWEKYIPVLDSFSGVFGVIIMFAGGIFVMNGWMTIGELVTYSSFVWAINQPVRMAGWLINDAQRFAASAEKVSKLAGEEPRIVSCSNCYSPASFLGRIELRGVTFSYGDEPVLNDVSFTVEPGEFACIIGPTGSGKTTIFMLIMRFYDVQKGSVLVDGVDVRDWDLKALRKCAGIAMADVFLFSDTLESNIRYSNPDAETHFVREASKIAEVDSFAVELASGYDTIIGERGVGLSGGQKQRLALARLLVRNPEVLLLDSTTSSVDIRTERAIHESLKDRIAFKTTIMIAHRISSVMDADAIFVLEGGRITEYGKHESLVTRPGWYRKTFVQQGGLTPQDAQGYGANG